MTKPVTIPNTFATATTAIPLSQLDSDFSAVATALNDANTYSNYAADTGVANAYVVTLTGVSTTYSAGLRIQFKAGAANTGASTLNVNGGGTKNITFQDASALSSGTIAANAIVDVMYDGTQFLLMNDPAGTVGTGDVVGPAGATDNAIVRFDGATGKLVQNSVVTIADSTGDVAGVGALSATGNVSFDGGTFVFNESGADKDFRIEGDTEPNLFFTDASTDRVGIGTSLPSSKLEVKNNSATVFNPSTAAFNTILTLTNTTSGASTNALLAFFTESNGEWYIGGVQNSGNTAADFVWTARASGSRSERMRLDSSGNLGLGVTPSAWTNSFGVIQGLGGWSISHNGANSNSVDFLSNAYRSGGANTYLYLASANATRYQQLAGVHAWYTAPSGTAGATTSITSGQVYTVTTLGSTTLGQWQAYFSGLSSIPSIGQSITATATGTLAGGATVTQTITFTQAMTLDASGNLQIGNTSYAYRVAASRASDGIVGYFRRDGATVNPALTISCNETGNTVGFGTDYAGATSPAMTFSTQGSERARIDSSGVFTVGTTSKTTDTDIKLSTDNRTYGIRNDRAASRLDIVDFTASAVRASIDSSGNLLVGTTNTALNAGVGVKIRNDLSGRNVSIVSDESTNAAEGFMMYSTGAAAYRFYVQWDGKINATNTTIAGISDQRLKENIRDLDIGLNAIMALKPRKFDWKAGKGKDIKGDRGWIAQEFEEVFPDLIDEWKDPAPEGEEPYKSVRADLIPVLVKAIQEQQAIITSLTARVAALEGTQP